MAETDATDLLDRVPIITTDPYALDTLADPLPFHQQLREAGPVVRLERYGIWGMARYEQVSAGLRNLENFSSASGAGLSDFRKEKPWRTPSLLLEADPPQHTRARQVVGPLLTPRALEKWRESWQRTAEALTDRMVVAGTFDALPDFAEAYSLAVFADAVGLPEEGRENLLPYGHLVFNGFGPRNELLAEAMAHAEGVQTWIAASCRREALHPGGVGAQIYASVDAGKITDQEAALLVRSLLSAGLVTMANTLVAALFAFGTYPDQWQLLREDRSLVPSAFEEVLRWESPVQTFFRTTTREVDVAGAHIPAGEKVLLFLGAANRDPRRWNDPDRFDITRNATGHVGLGVGIHQCVGQTVARLEGGLLLTALAQRVERIELAGQPQRRLNNTLRAWHHLPVKVVAYKTSHKPTQVLVPPTTVKHTPPSR
jgi:4-methoxybenzoate monooxygenase (O-demethylating)